MWKRSIKESGGALTGLHGNLILIICGENIEKNWKCFFPLIRA